MGEPTRLTSLEVGGIPILGSAGIPSMYGDYWFVDARRGNDGNDGVNKSEAFEKYSTAYAAAASDNNDVIVINGDATIEEATKISWTKNRIHTVVLGGGFMSGQRGKLQLSTAGNTVAVDSTLEVSGVGNTFHGLKIMNEGTDAASVAALIDSGEANWFNNCSFMKFSDLNVAAVADVICRSDSTSYTNCEIGFDTLVQSAARASFWIKNSGATRMKHLYMQNCNFTCSSSASTKSFILVANTSSCAFSNTLKDCSFNNALVSSASAAALADAVTSVSGLVEGNLLFINPASNCLEFCSAVTDQVKVIGPAMDGTSPAEKMGIALTPA